MQGKTDSAPTTGGWEVSRQPWVGSYGRVTGGDVRSRLQLG